MRPVRHGFVLCIGIALAIAGACWVIQDRWFRSKLAQAKKDMADRRYGAARSQLTRLASWWSAGGEIDYLLGSCEQAAGALKTHWPPGIGCRSTRRSRRKRPSNAVPWR